MTGFEQVLDWLEGRLAPVQAARVAAAVEADPELAAVAAWLGEFRAAAAGTVLEEPPAHVHALLLRRFAAYRPAPPTPLRRLRAVVSFDSSGASAVGVRAGAAVAGQRHVVLESEAVDVALDVYDEDVARRVEGQLLPPGTEEIAGAEVRLLGPGGDLVAAASAGPSGVFALPPVPAGGYMLQVRWDGLVVDADLELP
ncbi:MAG: carboxypeptidase-like regulatory domain-containing protein [Actinomycetota bacterium]|nr:carboxypeptidase-like regulatory domain-containing protein [Actinomycetota bacterium]